MDAIRLNKKEFIQRLDTYNANTFGMHIINISGNVVNFCEYPRSRITSLIKKLNTIKGKYIYLNYKYSKSNFNYLIEYNTWTKSLIIKLPSFKYIRNLKER